jgi:hypothetical protein
MDKRYASIRNPTISAITHALYRFASAKEAAERIGMLRNHFIIAKQQIDNPAHPSVILWIKGYGLMPEDAAKGIVGHFAVVSYKENGGKFTLYATKMEADVREHPQRGQVKRDNPNWGHPVLRSARKGRTYPTLEEAEAELALLHEHYPKVSIPNPGKLFIMIYCSDRPAKERMVKHVLEIKANEEGAYYIEVQENAAKNLRKRGKPQPKAESLSPQGYFTAKVALKRKNRPKKPVANEDKG